MQLGERVQLLLKRCIAFGDEGNRSCDVFFTDYRICFVGKAGTDVAILHAVVERIRAYPVDKNVPSNLRVPDGNLSDFALFNVSGHSIYVEIFCKYFRTVYFAFNPKVLLAQLHMYTQWNSRCNTLPQSQRCYRAKCRSHPSSLPMPSRCCFCAQF